MRDQDRLAVWDRIDAWSQAEPDENLRSALREQIRRKALTRRGSLRGLEADQRDRARDTCEKLASPDPVRRHAWLFSAPWLQYSADELDEEDFDVDKRETRVDALRTEAMEEIWSSCGLDGVLALLSDGDGWTVGRYAARRAVGLWVATKVLRTCVSTDTESPKALDAFMQGFMSCLDEDIRSTVLSTLAENATLDQIVLLFKCAPFHDRTWRLLDRQNRHVRDRYWRTVFPAIARFTEAETTELIDRLLAAGRPTAAFCAVEFDWVKVETSRLKRLLADVISRDSESEGVRGSFQDRLAASLGGIGFTRRTSGRHGG